MHASEIRVNLVDALWSFVDGSKAEVARTSAAGVFGYGQQVCQRPHVVVRNTPTYVGRASPGSRRECGEVFGDEVVAAAMIDRLVHHAEVLTLAGESYRTRARRELLAKDRDK